MPLVRGDYPPHVVLLGKVCFASLARKHACRLPDVSSVQVSSKPIHGPKPKTSPNAEHPGPGPRLFPAHEAVWGFVWAGWASLRSHDDGGLGVERRTSRNGCNHEQEIIRVAKAMVMPANRHLPTRPIYLSLQKHILRRDPQRLVHTPPSYYIG